WVSVVPGPSQEVLVARDCASACRNVVLKARERVRYLVIQVLHAAEWPVHVGTQAHLQPVVKRASHGEEHYVLPYVRIDAGKCRVSPEQEAREAAAQSVRRVQTVMGIVNDGGWPWDVVALVIRS